MQVQVQAIGYCTVKINSEYIMALYRWVWTSLVQVNVEIHYVHCDVGSSTPFYT
jgi:hypothetical protein